MDRDEALKLLAGGPDGVQEWNRHRADGEPIPNLSEAILSEADLRFAELIGANLNNAFLTDAKLSKAYLIDADLSEANLIRADLYAADLRDAKFIGAKLHLAKLSRACLGGADLRNADLSGAGLDNADLTDSDLREANLSDVTLDFADLSGANLSSADLTGANLCATELRDTVLDRAVFAYTTIATVDLSHTQGLAAVCFEGPCSIGVDTLILSKGRIPKSFLEGCGVPDAWIEYLPSLIASQEPIQYHSCFISHSHADRAFCERLHSRMREAKLRVWYAPEDMKGGRKLRGQIDRAIRSHDKLLLVLSEQSMQSEWVATEIHAARKREIEEKRQVLFPIRLVDMAAIKAWECFDADSGKDMGREVREYFIPDFSEWEDEGRFEEAFARLLADLKASAA